MDNNKPSTFTEVVLDALKCSIRELEIRLEHGVYGYGQQSRDDLARYKKLLAMMESDHLDVSFRSRTF